MERRSLGAGAAWGALLGIAAGYADGWSAHTATLSGSWDALPWAVGVDGALGTVAGLLLHRVLPRRALPALVLAALGVAGAVGIAAGDEAVPAVPPVEEVPGQAPSLLVLAVPDLPADLGALPATASFTASATSFPRTFATATDRSGALAGLLGLVPADGVSLAEVARWAGHVPLAVVQGDDADDRGLFDGYAVATVRPPSPLPPGLGDVAVVRAFLPDPEPVAPAAVVDRVGEVLRVADGRRFVLVVELPPWDDAAALDAALDAVRGRAVAAAPHGLDVLLVGLPGDGRPGGQPLEPAVTRTPAWLVRHDATVPAVRRGDTSAADLAATWAAGVFRERVNVGEGAVARVEPPARAIGNDRGSRVTCALFHDQDPADRAAVTQGRDGAVVRHAGFALVVGVDGAPRGLFDEVTDPYWGRDLLGVEGEPCGMSVAGRVAALQARAEARRRVPEEAKALPPRPPDLPGAPRGRWPDPFAAFPDLDPASGTATP